MLKASDMVRKSHSELAFSTLVEGFGTTKCQIIDKNQAVLKINDHQQSWGYEDGPWKGGRAHLCWWPLIFKKNFLISVLSDLSVLMTT